MMMILPFQGFALVTLGIVAACAAVPSESDPSAVTVTALAETVPVGTTNEDAADDPAIWRNGADPAASLIVGTDKKGGLYVYNLAGEQMSFLPAPGLNNVDLIELSDGRILVAASDRSELARAHIFFAFLDPDTAMLTEDQRVEVGAGEGYGICLSAQREDGSLLVFSAPKEGTIYRTEVSFADGTISESTTVIGQVPSQPEGCVVDDRTNTLYIGEEAVGVWAFDLATNAKILIAEVGTGMLVADVEGLALAPEGEDGGYLVASSQGDNAYAVYRLPDHAPVGRFRIAEGEFGSAEETDGIELDPRSFGPDYPAGLFIAQDGINPPNAQNFKLARWDEILAALETETVPQ